MPHETFWCIVITAGGSASLIFAVKLAKNFKNFEKNFFFALKNTFNLKVQLESFKPSQQKKVNKNFFSDQIGHQFFAFLKIFSGIKTKVKFFCKNI